MPCLPCLALPIAAVGGSSAFVAHSYKIFIATTVATIAALAIYYYYAYMKPCASCKV